MAILMEESYWRNSHLSVAKYYGGVNINVAGKMREYLVVNKEGITLQELSDPNSKHYVGDENMAIPPGEPVDLIDKEFIKYYKMLGRDKFISILKEHNLSSIPELKKIFDTAQ